MRIAIVTAGAAGMICGSCLRDNALARSLHRLGHDVQLVPLYSPIRTDLPNAAVAPIFLGGVNAYLRQKYPPMRIVPPALTRWLDHPRLITWLAGRAVRTEPSELGDLTLTVLRAERGLLRAEVERLANWLSASKPDVVHFSNMMIAGAARRIQAQTRAAIVVSLQGDDIFLDGLPDHFRKQVADEVTQFESSIDAYVVHSNFYARKMAAYLGLSETKLQVSPLATELEDLAAIEPQSAREPTLRIGYLARLAPEKGLHLLCEAFVKLRERPQLQQAELHIAGYLGNQHRGYVEHCLGPVRAIDPAACRLWGEVDRQRKMDFLQHVDVVSVPSPYEEPKGLYVLEALAAGVPVVQPQHGAFPELLASTGGGLLFDPNSIESLTDTLARLLGDPQLRELLGRTGRAAVLQKHTSTSEARTMVNLYQQLIGTTPYKAHS